MCFKTNPAWAGKIRHFRIWLDDPRAIHPRTGGENVFAVLVGIPVDSPPRRRGKPDLLILAQVAEGFTPTQAGKNSTTSKFIHQEGGRF